MDTGQAITAALQDSIMRDYARLQIEHRERYGKLNGMIQARQICVSLGHFI